MLRASGTLTPDQARSFLTFRLPVGVGARAIRIALRFTPARSGKLRNLVTLTVFDPHGFRGAAHRHDPAQQVTIGRDTATPGFLPGPLAPGDWVIELDLHAVLPSSAGGVQYKLQAHVEDDSDGAADLPPDGDGPVPDSPPLEVGVPQQRQPAAIPLQTEEPVRWLKGDLHFHSNHSDGRWTLDDIVEYVRRNHLDFVALTDHNTTSASEALHDALAAAGLHVITIPALELTTFWGHANALGVSRWIDWRVRGPEGLPRQIGSDPDAAETRTFAHAAAEVHEAGGLFVINHPRAAGYPICTGCRWEQGDASATYADAIEVMNGPWPRPQNAGALELWDRWLNSGHRIPAIAGSDSHGFAHHPAQLGFTFVRAAPDATAILDAVRAGVSYMSRGPAVIWRSPTPAQRMAPEATELVLDVQGVSAAMEAVVIGGGQRIATHLIREDGEVRLPLNGTREAWYRVELRDARGEVMALTNPAFV